jgi:two-component system cell cycle sensor histidine kinase/response regulator CckA
MLYRNPTAFEEERRTAHESARLRLARLRVHGGSSLRRVFHEATTLAARTLGCARVGVWLFVDDHAAIRCFELYDRSLETHDEGASIRRADFPHYFRALEERRVIVADDARTHPATRELSESYLVPLGITSMLDAPIYREGAVIGVVCHEHIGPARKWVQEDIEFAVSVAESIALQFEGAARQDAEAALHATEAYVAEVQKMEALGRLCAGVSHDFRNLLTVVLGHAGLIEQDPTASPSVRAEAERVRLAAERGVQLTRELSTFGRSEASTPPSVVKVRDVIDGFDDILRGAAGRRHQLEVHLGSGDARVLINPGQLERVLLNLVVNAREALPDGGTIEVKVHDKRVSGVDEHPGHFVVIDVTDHGVGMDEATQDRMFEPFFTTRPESQGSGLGLAIAYRIVDQAGGFLHVESAAGRGTTMSVYLPRVAGGTDGGSPA